MKKAINLRTLDEFQQFTKVFNPYGIQEYKWIKLKEKFCMDIGNGNKFENGQYESVDYFKSEGYQILTYQEWLNERKESFKVRITKEGSGRWYYAKVDKEFTVKIDGDLKHYLIVEGAQKGSYLKIDDCEIINEQFKNGDMIEVSNNGKDCWRKRQFIGMHGDKFVCVVLERPMDYCSWIFARPIQTITLTLDEAKKIIAESKGVSEENIKII